MRAIQDCAFEHPSEGMLIFIQISDPLSEVPLEGFI